MARFGNRASGGRPRSITTSMRFFRSACRCSESRMWGGITRRSNSRSSVISLLGNSLLRETRKSGTLKIMVVQLQQDRDLEQHLEQSKTNPVLIFKHSTQCPISSHAYEEFTEFAEAADGLTCALVLVIENRNVSNTIAERLNVP